MDDFRNRLFSLSYLRSFPFDKIKIDRSFISDIAENDDSGADRAGGHQPGGRLNMATTAEGVETQGQLDKVQMLGCTEMQGYLYSRPVPAGRGPLFPRARESRPARLKGGSRRPHWASSH